MAIPTLSQIRERIKADILNETSVSVESRRNVLNFIINALTGVVYSAYRYINTLATAIFPQTATSSNLDNWGQVISLPRVQATRAELNLTLTLSAAPSPAITIPENTEFQSTGGLSFLSQSSTLIDDLSNTVVVTSSGTGTSYNLNVGDTLVFSSAIAGLPSQVTVGSVRVQAQDIETDASFSQRIISFFSKTAYKTGSFEDFIEFTKAASTLVSRVWIINKISGDGTIGVFVTKRAPETTDSVFLDFTESEREDILEYIDERKPLPSDVSVLNPTFTTIDFTITLSENITSNQTLVRNAIKEFFFRNVQVRGARVTHSGEETYTGNLILSAILTTVIAAVPSTVQVAITSPTSILALTTTSTAYDIGTITFVDA